jgi:VIT1/CCC1 family predicted Fe2+/Mn2+ transporter
MLYPLFDHQGMVGGMLAMLAMLALFISALPIGELLWAHANGKEPEPWAAPTIAMVTGSMLLLFVFGVLFGY